MLKKALLTSAAVAAAATSSVAAADVTGNFAVTSNYIFRGFQADQPAVQGGLDWTGKSGVYAGVWLSNSAGGNADTEVDLYGGFASGMFDVGAIYYAFPQQDDGGNSGSSNTLEIYAGLAGENWDSKLYYGFGTEDGGDKDSKDEYVYIEGNYTMGAVDLHAGVKQVTGDSKDDNGKKDNVMDVSAQYNVGDFGFGVAFVFNHDNGNGDSANNERPQFYVNWSQEFEVK